MKKYNQILLIDDDSTTNFINKRLIQKLNMSNEIVLAFNGKEALQFLLQNCKNSGICPEVIFLDINMPVMDGFEFLEEYEGLKFKNKKTVKVYMLTTSTNLNDFKKIEKYKVAGFFDKPLTNEKLGSIF